MTRSPISAAQAMEWEERTARFRPKPILLTESVKAAEIPSFATFGGEDGVILRLAGTTGGSIDIFLNAAVTVQMINKLCEIGEKAGWRSPETGSLMVHDPQNLGHPGPKS